MPLFTRVKQLLKFVLPIALWCFLYRGLLWGKLLISEDTFAVFALVKYFLVNLKMGIFAHWNPFMHWGMGHVFQVGEFNPLWMVTLLLNALGVDFYHAFLWTVALYLVVAAFGVYALLRRLFPEEFLAYLGFLLFLFSGVGMTLFTQVTLILLFVPAIWFFYFLVEFYQTRRTASVLLLSFTLMLIATTYIPFYFATVLMVALILGVVLYPSVVIHLFQDFMAWARQNPFLAILAIGAVAVAVTTSVLNWLFLKSDFMVLARPTVMTYDSVKDSGIPISEALRDQSLFSLFIQLLQAPILVNAREIFSLDNIAYDNQRIFYVPALAHLVLLCGIVARLNKRMVYWGFLGLVLFLIALARLTPVYGLLFKYVPCFDMFRNIFLLTPFIITIYIIFTVEVFRSFWLKAASRNYVSLFVAVLVIGLYGLLWSRPGYTLHTTYAVAVGFLVVTVLRFLGVSFLRGRWGKAALVGLAVISPMEVLFLHARQFSHNHSDAIVKAAHTPLAPPQFSFVRQITQYDETKANDIYRWYNWHIIAMQDSDRFITTKYGYPTYWSYMLAPMVESIPGFKDYVRHKFIVYPQNISSQPATSPHGFAKEFVLRPNGILINGPGQGITVQRFNANQISLAVDFPTPRFLLYNDSFHPFWKATINGKPVPISRANFAFKGLDIPAGRAEVHLEFRPLGGTIMYMFLMAFFYFYFGFGLQQWRRDRRRLAL